MRISEEKGTLIFSTPPEFYKNGQITFKADIWALGCTLYYLATLEHPFQGNKDQLEITILQQEPKHLDNYYSNELDKFIFNMINKDCLKRPSSSECLNLISPKYKDLFESKTVISFDNFIFDMFKLYMGIDIPPEIKEEFNEFYYLIYEFPKYTIREFECLNCEKENKKIYPFIKIDVFPPYNVECFCQNGHYFSQSIKEFYRNFTSSKSYRKEIDELICSECKSRNVYISKGMYFKFCEICKIILCPECEIKHNPEHNLRERYLNGDNNLIFL